MKTLLRFALCLVCVCAMLQAHSQSKSWSLFANDQSFNVSAMVQLPDRSMVITGTPNSTWYYDSTYYGGTSMIIARIGSNGNVMWAKSHQGVDAYYGATGSGLFYANNALYVGFSTMDPVLYATTSGIMKLDLNGNVLLSKANTSGQMDYNYSANRIAQLPNGNLVIMKSLTSSFVVECLDADLNIVWAKSINPDPEDMKNPGLGLDVTEDGDICVSGKSNNRLAYVSLSSNGDYQFGYRLDNATRYFQARNVFRVSDGLVMQGLITDYTGASYYSQAFVCKLTSNGYMQWMKVIKDANNPNYDFSISKAHVTENGTFLFSGYTTLGTLACGELDKDGNVMWSRVSSAPVAAGGYGYGSYADMPFVVEGDDVTLVQYQSEYPYGNSASITFTTHDALVDNAVCGLVESEVITVEDNFDYAVYAIPASNMTTMYVTYEPYAVTLTDEMANLQTVEVCETVVTGTGITPSVSGIAVYPNPASGYLIVNGSENATVKIYSAVGALVGEYNLVNGVANIDITQFASGAYLATVVSNSGIQSHKFSVQR